MCRKHWLFVTMFLWTANGCARLAPTTRAVARAEAGLIVIDAGGRSIEALEIGSSLHVGARGLEPRTTYEFRLGLDGDEVETTRAAVSFARTSSDAQGNIAPLILWYESGIIGCSPRVREASTLPPYRFRTFEEAENSLRGKVLTVSIHKVERDETGRVPPLNLGTSASVGRIDLPILPRHSPTIYASTPTGCLLNSQAVSDDDVYVTGRNFTPGEIVNVSIVTNQHAWHTNDLINDITGIDAAAMPEVVTADATGSFIVKVWDRTNERRGVYDVVAHRNPEAVAQAQRLRANDIVSFGSETGIVLYLRYPIGGPTMDIAGRPLAWSPYFEFADSFAETTDPVWGAVDPTYVPASHLGGTYAAYYVVDHRDVNGWNPMAGGAIDLVDKSGSIEIMPVKAGCVNGTETIIWQPPLKMGTYDVVVDFGLNPAETQPAYATDNQYDASVDFLDGADQVGFVVATDPYELGSIPIGEDSYNQDDFFTTLGSRANVDLRAVVRYPATSPGSGAPVAPGQHPLFVIEHGNHASCREDGFDCSFGGYDDVHTGCPTRVPNHLGYMHLLDILASHGIIAVSIDAYDLTGCVPQLTTERGDLILKHIELWSHMNNPATFTTYPDFFAGRFVNHLDFTKISVSGHSRGGEASVAAYMRNTTFSIGSVSSIAPVDVLSYVLPDVPYFVILPAADGDVSDLSGARIYDRAGSGLMPVDATTKSGIDVYGACHNFFNTVWAADNDDSWFPRDDFIPATDQQKIGEAYLAAFVRVHLNNEGVYQDMLRGKLKFPSFAGRKIYAMHHEKLNAKSEAGSGSGAVAAGGATKTAVTSPSVHETDALKVGWGGSAAQLTYSLPVGQQDVSSFEVLSFRVAQTNAASNPISGDQDFQIELIGAGHSKGVFSSRFGPIPKPYNRGGANQNVMTTIRVPLHSFIMNNSEVPLNNIDTLRFSFLNPIAGEIYVDDIEFSR